MEPSVSETDLKLKRFSNQSEFQVSINSEKDVMGDQTSDGITL
jgi:hypothetical protein